MNYSEKIFEILGIKPYEEFYIKGHKHKYRINQNLIVEVEPQEENHILWTSSTYVGIRSILLGKKKIIKIPKRTITKKDQIVIDYAKLLGFNWIAKDENGRVYAYKEKPVKLINERVWDAAPCQNLKSNISMKRGGIGQFPHQATPIFFSISLISWEDEEPYYIGD